MKLPRFRIAWIMVAVAIAAFEFGAIRAVLDYQMYSNCRERGVLVLWGALPMANVLAVGMLNGQRRPGSRPFLLGFEASGAIALALFIAVAICFPHEVVYAYVLPFLDPVQTIIGPGGAFVYIPIRCFVALVLLGGPQVAFALIGGFLSRRFKITVTPR